MTVIAGNGHHKSQRRLAWGIMIVLLYIAVILTLAFLAELAHGGVF